MKKEEIRAREIEAINYNHYVKAISNQILTIRGYKDFKDWVEEKPERLINFKGDLKSIKKGYNTIYEVAWDYDMLVVIVKKCLKDWGV